MKDIQAYISLKTDVNVPINTLKYRVKECLGYSYKKCSIVNPDTDKEVNIIH